MQRKQAQAPVVGLVGLLPRAVQVDDVIDTEEAVVADGALARGGWWERKVALVTVILLMVAFVQRSTQTSVTMSTRASSWRSAAQSSERLWSPPAEAVPLQALTPLPTARGSSDSSSRTSGVVREKAAQAARQDVVPTLSFVVFIKDRFELLVNCSRASLGSAKRKRGDQCSHLTEGELEAYRRLTGSAVEPIAAAGLSKREYQEEVSSSHSGDVLGERSWVVLKIALFSNLIDSIWAQLLPGDVWELALCDLGSTDVKLEQVLHTLFAAKRAEWREWMAKERVAMREDAMRAGATRGEMAAQFVLPPTPEIRLRYRRDAVTPFSRGAGRNCAASLATGETLFFVDADMRFDARDAIDKALEIAAPAKGKKTRKSKQKSKRRRKAYVPIVPSFHGPLHRRKYTRSFGTGNVAISRETYDALGLSWEVRGKWGKEDDRMFKMIRRKIGRRNIVRENAMTMLHQWHPNSGTFKDRHSGERPG